MRRQGRLKVLNTVILLVAITLLIVVHFVVASRLDNVEYIGQSSRLISHSRRGLYAGFLSALVSAHIITLFLFKNCSYEVLRIKDKSPKIFFRIYSLYFGPPLAGIAVSFLLEGSIVTAWIGGIVGVVTYTMLWSLFSSEKSNEK